MRAHRRLDMRPHRLLLPTILLLAPALALAGCVGGEAKAGYETHDVAEWKTRYESTPDAFLLDVRTPQEFAEAHIEGATLIPYTELRAYAHMLPEDKEAPIFVYCRSGNRSAIGSETLVDLGYTSVHNMGGGINDWMASGYPVVQ